MGISTSASLRQLLRRLLRSPVFTGVSVVTLALGIGANAAIFSVIEGVLLRPLPFPEPDRLVGVWHTAPGLGFENVNQSPALYFTYRDSSQTFEDIGMWDNDAVSVTGLDEPERVEAMYVTDGTLPILGIQPVLGRTFTAADDSPGSPRTALVSHGYWQRRFGGKNDVLGKTIRVDGEVHEIIGVLPRDLEFLRYEPDLFLPFQFDRTEVFIGNFSYQSVARLAPGATIEEANADVARMIPLAVENFPKGLTLQNLQEAQFGPNVHPLEEDVVGDIGNVLWVLLGAVGLVLLIACANVANLFLVRTDARQRELALRTALGASRVRLSKELLLESTTLGLVGGALGLLLAYGGIRLLVAMGPESLPRLSEIPIDSDVLGFTLALSLLSGLFFGLFPLVKYGRLSLSSTLKEGGRGSSDGPERHRARSLLVVTQVALALVLLVGSGLMIRSFAAMRQVHPGFYRPEEVLTLRVSIPEAEIADSEQRVRAFQAMSDRISALPGVRSVGLASSVPMDGWDSNDAINVEDFPVPEGQIPPIRRFKWVSEGYFETMENPVLAGRGLTWKDAYDKAPVVVVTENFAREYWKDPARAIGKRIKQSLDKEVWREIVGVVGDVHDDGVDEKATAIIYWPMLVGDFWEREVFAQQSMVFAIRNGRIGSSGFLGEIRDAVWSVNPNVPIANVRTLAELLDGSMARTSFTLVMLVIASGVALLLGGIGIYGVISYTVSQRTREIGVRMALGAARADVGRLVLREGLGLTLAGIAAGLAAAYGLTKLMSSLLYGVSPADPVTYLAVAPALAAIALFASWLPARRAAGLDPTEALRWE